MKRSVSKASVLLLCLLPVAVLASNDHGTGLNAVEAMSWWQYLAAWWPF